MAKARVQNLDRLLAKLGRLSEGQKDAARVEVKRSALNVQNGARRRVAVDEGRLKNSITHETAPDGLAARIGTNVTYAPPVEFGRRAGTMPPPGSLLGWLKRHGLPPEAEYAIRLKIARQGQAARPFLFPAFEQEVPSFNRRLRSALRKAAREAAS